MAREAERLPENADGDFFVDRSCIDCAICRQVAPASFTRSDRAGASIVFRQPANDAETHRAKMALVACPSSSIGARGKPSLDDAIAAFPEPLGDGVHFCGFASESSYGAQSYFIQRAGGNVLVDSPRATPKLLDRIEELGGVKYMFLTHRDDVADHEKFARRFGCTRILHADDVTTDTKDVEEKLTGNDVIVLADDLRAIPVPGHTRGSMALLFNDVLFSGDHLFADEGGSEIYAARSVCWYSWAEQKRSLARLLEVDFSWLLPGHDYRLRAKSPAEMRTHLRAAIARAETR